MLAIIKRLPLMVTFLLLIISMFLLTFLLFGCYNNTSAYSDIYLTSLRFNNDYIGDVEFKNTTDTQVSEFMIKIGYLNFCVDVNDAVTCTSFDNLDKMAMYPLVKVEIEGEQDEDNNSNNNNNNKHASGDLDLIKLAKNINEFCYPYILMTSICLTVIVLAIALYMMIPLLPGKFLARKVSCVVCLINVVVWGVGSTLQHVAANAVKYLVPDTSMLLIKVSIGSRAEALVWTSFTFLIIVAMSNVCMFVIETKKNKKEVKNEGDSRYGCKY